MLQWNRRVVGREAAAAACHMPLDTLDVWLHRYKAPSAKLSGKRVFSIQDLTILQVARRLLSPGRLARTAIDIAVPLLDDPPDYDAALYVTADASFVRSQDDWPDCDFTSVNVGWIAHDLSKKLEAV